MNDKFSIIATVVTAIIVIIFELIKNGGVEMSMKTMIVIAVLAVVIHQLLK